MTDLPPNAETGDESNGEPATGPPWWVNVFGAIALVLVVLFVVLLVIGGDHGPGRHTQPGGPGDGSSQSNVTR